MAINFHYCGSPNWMLSSDWYACWLRLYIVYSIYAQIVGKYFARKVFHACVHFSISCSFTQIKCCLFFPGYSRLLFFLFHNEKLLGNHSIINNSILQHIFGKNIGRENKPQNIRMKSRKRTAKSSHSCASLHKYIKFRFEGGKTQLQLEPSLIYILNPNPIYWIHEHVR